MAFHFIIISFCEMYPLSYELTNKSAQLSGHIKMRTEANARLSRRYRDLLQCEKYCDCFFIISDIKIKCHKLILSAASPVFEAMFFGPVRDRHHEIEIVDMTAEVFRALIHYIYVGSLETDDFTLEEIIELYYGAEKYLLSELVEDCLAAIMRKLRFENILPALELSICMNLSGLQNVCMTFFVRCCLRDPQYINYLKNHYDHHISKECIKTIIEVNKNIQNELLWFVYEWCQRECKELGLQKNQQALVFDGLNLESNNFPGIYASQSPPHLGHCLTLERTYYKACRPFMIDQDTNVWKFSIKCNHFIALYGLILHSRLIPTNNLPFAFRMSTTTTVPNEYLESLIIEIYSNDKRTRKSASNHNSSSDSSDEEVDVNDHDRDHDHDHDDHDMNNYSDNEASMEPQTCIWRHAIIKQPTKYNCDLNIRWNNSVTLNPDTLYQIKIIWAPEELTCGAEYPCSLMSNLVNGIQFKDNYHYFGSLVKGLNYINLV